MSRSVESHKSLTICKVIWQNGVYLASFSLWILESHLITTGRIPVPCQSFIHSFVKYYSFPSVGHAQSMVLGMRCWTKPTKLSALIVLISLPGAFISLSFLWSTVRQHLQVDTLNLSLTSVPLCAVPIVSQVRFTVELNARLRISWPRSNLTWLGLSMS